MIRQLRFSILFSFAIIYMSISTAGSTNKTLTGNVRQVRIAMAQIICFDSDKSGNLVRIENAIIEAREKKADLILFPESCLLGWVNPEAYQRACPIPGNDSEIICRLAKKYKIHISIGLDEKVGDKLYDSAILVDENGNILLKHRKINVLPELMTPPYSTGDGVNTVNTKFGIIGLMICADSFRENLLKSMKDKKPDVLLIPYGWAAPENAWPTHGQELLKVVKNTAIKVNCPVIGTNLVGQISHGPWTGQIYGGLSVAFDNRNDNLIIGKDRERDIAIITIDISN
jgi:predicted amidohydrolase